MNDTEKEITETTYGVYSFMLEMAMSVIAFIGRVFTMGRKSRGSVIQF